MNNPSTAALAPLTPEDSGNLKQTVYIPTRHAEPLGVFGDLDSACKVLEKKFGRKISTSGLKWQERFNGWECFHQGMYVGMIWKSVFCGMCR